jgi:alkaline phosphatase D
MDAKSPSRGVSGVVENQPVRTPRANSWAELLIMRRVDWGDLARIYMLEGRQYRSDQSCDDGDKDIPCGDCDDPKRTMLGTEQEKWLSDGPASSKQHWQILANQVMLAPYDSAPGPKRKFSMDKRGGYPAESERLLSSIATHAPSRTITITGDIHSDWVNELHRGFADDDTPIIAAEFVGTSITSGGDGVDRPAQVTAALSDNPHIKWQNSRRGYVVCRLAEDSASADYRTVQYVSKPDAPVATASRWRIEHGRPGITTV